MREGTSMSSVARQRRPRLAPARPSRRSRGSAPVVVVDLQRADAGREVDDAGRAARARAPPSARGRGSAAPRSSTSGPYSTSRLASPSWRIDHRRALARAARAARARSRRRRPAAAARRRRAAARRAQRRRASRLLRALARAAPRSSDDGDEPHRVARRAGPSSTARPSTIVAGQTKPPRLGPSGPRMIGMSPVKSMVPTA